MKKSFVIILLLLSFGFIANVNQVFAKEDLNKYLFSSHKKFAQGNNKGALEDLTLFIKKSPQKSPLKPKAYGFRGVIKTKLKDYKGAMDDFNKALTLKPKFALAFSSRGYTKFMQGKYKHALDDINRAISLDPKHALSYAYRGIAKIKLKQYKSALKDFDQAIEFDHAEAWGYKGLVMERLNDRKTAATYFKKFNKSFSDPYVEYLAILNEFPDSALINYYLGFFAYFKQQPDMAIDYLNKTISINPKDATAYNTRGMVYDAINNTTAAKKDFTKSIKHNPNFFLPYRNRAFINIKEEKLNQAVKDLTSSINNYTESIYQDVYFDYYYRGTLYVRLKQIDKAIADFSKAIDYYPDYAEAYLSRGFLYLKLNIDEYKAQFDLTKARDLFIEQNKLEHIDALNKALEMY